MVGPPRSPRHCGGAAVRGVGRGRAPAHRHGPALVARQRRAHHGRRHLPRRVLRDGAGDPGVVLGRLQPLFVGHYIRRSRRTACGRDALVAGRAARARAARRAHPGRLSLRADGRAICRRLWGQQRRVGAPLASGRLPRRRHHPPAPLREPLRRRHGRPGQPPQRQGDRVPDVRRPRRRLRVRTALHVSRVSVRRRRAMAARPRAALSGPLRQDRGAQQRRALGRRHTVRAALHARALRPARDAQHGPRHHTPRPAL